MLSRAALLAVLIVAVASGCGGGDSSSSSADTEPVATTATDSTETTGGTDTEEPAGGTTGEFGAGESDGSFSPDSKICAEVTNQGSPLNIAASTGDFATVAVRWKLLAAGFPPDLQDDVKTLVEGYEKVAADPNAYGMMSSPPYSTSLEAINGYTATECAN